MVNDVEDRVLLETMAEAIRNGEKVGSTYKKEVWTRATAAVNTVYGKNLEVKYIKQRISNVLRPRYNNYQSLLGYSGFGLDAVGRVTAAPEVWDQLVAHNKKYEEFREAAPVNLELLELVFSSTRATSEYVDEFRDMLAPSAPSASSASSARAASSSPATPATPATTANPIASSAVLAAPRVRAASAIPQRKRSNHTLTHFTLDAASVAEAVVATFESYTFDCSAVTFLTCIQTEPMLAAYFSKMPEEKRAAFVRKYIVDNDLAEEASVDDVLSGSEIDEQ